MEVLGPGVRGAEGKEKGKGVVARRGLEEAQSKDAGRRTGTGYEVWHAWGELARDSQALHPRWDVLYKSGARIEGRVSYPGEVCTGSTGRVD